MNVKDVLKFVRAYIHIIVSLASVSVAVLLFLLKPPDIVFTILLIICLTFSWAGFLIYAITAGIAKRFNERTHRASSEELRREDDVLLQAVAFSQSVFFIFLNLIPESDINLAFKVLVPIVAILFYALRAWGKIKNSAKYRYWSVWALFSIVITTLVFFMLSLTEYFRDPANLLAYMYFSMVWSAVVALSLGVFLGSMRIIMAVLKKRYGCRQ